MISDVKKKTFIIWTFCNLPLKIFFSFSHLFVLFSFPFCLFSLSKSLFYFVIYLFYFVEVYQKFTLFLYILFHHRRWNEKISNLLSNASYCQFGSPKLNSIFLTKS
ncbi:hypothetical protein V8G54_018302 [Vigna mungo]|uniref:Uncharacterized protein n=1 Tax=Vigna mungo TaxID=3915 RepID=A0AAQ3N9V1_VIGMU